MMFWNRKSKEAPLEATIESDADTVTNVGSEAQPDTVEEVDVVEELIVELKVYFDNNTWLTLTKDPMPAETDRGEAKGDFGRFATWLMKPRHTTTHSDGFYKLTHRDGETYVRWNEIKRAEINFKVRPAPGESSSTS